MGWCIECLEVGDNVEERDSFDLFLHLCFHKLHLNVGIELKKLPNSRFLKELLQIYLEVMKLYFMNLEREQTLVEMANKAEAANRAKDIFLANMSHELRTPLNAILGFSQILMARPDFPDDVKVYMEKIHVSGNHLLNLVNTILDFAKLEAGKLAYQPENVSLKRIVTDVLILIAPQIREKGLEFQRPVVEPIEINLDFQLIKQVLVNLLSNSIKFTPEQGKIELAVEYLQDQKQCRFKIQDTGTGIHARELAEIFSPFYQVDNHFQKTNKGTGLGLAIAKKIVEELHGGRMWVESELGVGSTFYFTLPLHTNVARVDTFSVEDSEAPEILIVEDSEEFLQVLVERLRPAFHITATNSVHTAKELLHNQLYHAAVFDYFLVDGNSGELLSYMSEKEITVPVVLISVEKEIQNVLSVRNHKNVKAIYEKTEIDSIFRAVKEAS